ncbi:hypothetical protein [Actinocatenispora sera]|uniref:hypothetical protein n=1 Tax=Actinocatenispora sera TaxID=390989 RepID=UPI003CC7D16A
MPTARHRCHACAADRLAGIFGPETIHHYLQRSYAMLDAAARVHRHTPVLGVHFATDRLAALVNPMEPS